MSPYPRQKRIRSTRVAARSSSRRSCASRTSRFFKVLLPEVAQKYGLLEEIEVGTDGMVHAPGKPSFGTEIDFVLIRWSKIAVLRQRGDLAADA